MHTLGRMPAEAHADGGGPGSGQWHASRAREARRVAQGLRGTAPAGGWDAGPALL